MLISWDRSSRTDQLQMANSAGNSRSSQQGVGVWGAVEGRGRASPSRGDLGRQLCLGPLTPAGVKSGEVGVDDRERAQLSWVSALGLFQSFQTSCFTEREARPRQAPRLGLGINVSRMEAVADPSESCAGNPCRPGWHTRPCVALLPSRGFFHRLVVNGQTELRTDRAMSSSLQRSPQEPGGRSVHDLGVPRELLQIAESDSALSTFIETWPFLSYVSFVFIHSVH